jgi:hypothetical protein
MMEQMMMGSIKLWMMLATKYRLPKEGNKSDTNRQDAPSEQSHPEKNQLKN